MLALICSAVLLVEYARLCVPHIILGFCRVGSRGDRICTLQVLHTELVIVILFRFGAFFDKLTLSVTTELAGEFIWAVSHITLIFAILKTVLGVWTSKAAKTCVLGHPRNVRLLRDLFAAHDAATNLTIIASILGRIGQVACCPLHLTALILRLPSSNFWSVWAQFTVALALLHASSIFRIFLGILLLLPQALQVKIFPSCIASKQGLNHYRSTNFDTPFFCLFLAKVPTHELLHERCTAILMILLAHEGQLFLG